MRYAELLTLYFERSQALLTLWTLYVVVIGGLLAVAALRRRPDAVGGALATALYVVFAAQNLGGIRDATAQRLAALSAIHACAAPDAVGPARPAIEASLVPPSYAEGRAVHLGCDAGTVAALWALQWRRWRDGRRP